jgi:hypothetical protein
MSGFRYILSYCEYTFNKFIKYKKKNNYFPKKRTAEKGEKIEELL